MKNNIISKEFIQWIIDNHPDPAGWIYDYIKKEFQFYNEIRDLYIKQLKTVISTYTNKEIE